mmetsp:Transcript_17704/g.29113  ORF Transcript_17704/g.29113 Transcript_17704/m.29113 type:complete len:174 (-) Transcript_17704:1054-1575(-)
MRLRKEIENEPGVMFNAVRNVGSQKNHSDYSMYLMRSVFCLAIEGDCPATKRVFESIVAGCIPVILADDIILPFEDRFKWDEFAVFFNTNTTGKEILTKLREMPSFEIQSRQRALAEIWPFFTAHLDFTARPSFADLIIDEMCIKARILNQRLRRTTRIQKYKLNAQRVMNIS